MTTQGIAAEVAHVRRLTRKEEEDAKKKCEEDEARRQEDAERRVKEDKIIEQIEKEFWASTKKMNEEGVPKVRGEAVEGPGITPASSIDALISDDDLDR